VRCYDDTVWFTKHKWVNVSHNVSAALMTTQS
jgi:hypothetical protein